MGSLKLTTASSGSVILSPANTASDVTITVPATAGTMALTSQIPTSVGKVLQVVQTQSTTIQTVTGTSFVQLSSLNTSITPTSSSSKILISVSLSAGTSANAYPIWKLYRGATDLSPTGTGTGTDGMFYGMAFNTADTDVRMITLAYQYLDSPSTTSSTTYSVYVSPMRTSSQTVNLNQAITRGDSNQCRQTLATMTLMEIAA